MSQTTTAYGCDTSDMRFPHGLLRQGLSAPEAVLGRVNGDAERAAEVASYYANLLDFLHAHHGAEDELLWPKLRRRAPEHGELYERMEGQHAGIGDACDAAQAAVARYEVAPTPEHAQLLADRVTALMEELETHLSQEEREILPIAAVTMTQAEWGELPAHGARSFHGDKFWLILGLLFEQMNQAERRMTLENFPPPVREMWETEGQGAYIACIARIRGTAGTPAAG